MTFTLGALQQHKQITRASLKRSSSEQNNINPIGFAAAYVTFQLYFSASVPSMLSKSETLRVSLCGQSVVRVSSETHGNILETLWVYRGGDTTKTGEDRLSQQNEIYLQNQPVA
jgi:hypothetical protein